MVTSWVSYFPACSMVIVVIVRFVILSANQQFIRFDKAILYPEISLYPVPALVTSHRYNPVCTAARLTSRRHLFIRRFRRNYDDEDSLRSSVGAGTLRDTARARPTWGRASRCSRQSRTYSAGSATSPRCPCEAGSRTPRRW